MGRNIERLKQAREVIAYGAISGAVGNFAHLDPRVEEYVCDQLGLKPCQVSTQVIQRDRHADFLTNLAVVASSLEKNGHRDSQSAAHRYSGSGGTIQGRTKRIFGHAS
jgi:adenylosuccinate lyase